MGGSRGSLGGRMRGGGSMYLGGSGGGRGGSSNALRNHGSRGNLSNNKDYHSRRGGSFSSASGSYQSSSSFRRQSHSSSRGGRHDTAQSSHSARDGTTSTSVGNAGRKDENRRTLTDFKIIGLEIPKLDWKWGLIPESHQVKVKEDSTDESSHPLEDDSSLPQKSEHVDTIIRSESTADKLNLADSVESKSTALDHSASETTAGASSAFASPPPSRIRIYFHTPVSPDDFHPIPLASSVTHGTAPSDSRKGKRKKLEDDDGDLEDSRGPPPPPGLGSAISDDRSSVVASAPPSVADTVASEGDWLMAAIAEHDQDDIDADADAEDDEDGHQLHVSQIVDMHESDSMSKVVESSVNGEPLNLVGTLLCRVEPSSSCEWGGPPSCGRDSFHAADSGLLEGFHGLDVDMEGDDSRISTLAEVSSTNVGVDESVFAPTLNAGGMQDVAAVAGDTTSAPQDGDTSVLDDSSTLNTADADSTASSAASPVVAAVSTHIGDDDISSHDIEGALEATQIHEEHLHGSASSTPNVANVETMPASVSVPDASSLCVSIPHLETFGHSEEQPTDVGGYPEQHIDAPHLYSKPLVASYSFASTIPDDDQQELPGFSEDVGLSANDDTQVYDRQTADEQSVPVEDGTLENHTEPPKSPTPLPSTSSPSNHNDDKASLRPDGKGTRTPSANRVSISYAGGSRRLVLDAEVVDTLKLSRQEGRIDIHVNVSRVGDEDLKGILVRSLSLLGWHWTFCADVMNNRSRVFLTRQGHILQYQSYQNW